MRILINIQTGIPANLISTGPAATNPKFCTRTIKDETKVSDFDIRVFVRKAKLLQNQTRRSGSEINKT